MDLDQSDRKTVDQKLIQRLSSLLKRQDFTGYHKRFWSKPVRHQTYWCFGLTASSRSIPLLLKPIIGVRFEEVEEAYELILRPVISKKAMDLSRFTPTVRSNLIRIRADCCHTLSESSEFLAIYVTTIDSCAKYLVDALFEDGYKFLSDVSTLEGAADFLISSPTLLVDKAYKLPIILQLLKRSEEALEVLYEFQEQRVPGNFKDFAEALSQVIKTKTNDR